MADGLKLYESTPGLIRTKIEAHGAGLRLFAQRDQNDLVRQALLTAGQLWTSVFLPLRFSHYSEKVLGYNPGAAYALFKCQMVGKPVKFSGNIGNVRAPQDTPFVLTGNFKDAALAGARPTATSTKTKATVRIKVPTSHAMRAETLAVFKTIPAVEVKRIAQVIENTLIGLIGAKLAARMATTSPDAPADGRAPVASDALGGARETFGAVA